MDFGVDNPCWRCRGLGRAMKRVANRTCPRHKRIRTLRLRALGGRDIGRIPVPARSQALSFMDGSPDSYGKRRPQGYAT